MKKNQLEMLNRCISKGVEAGLEGLTRHEINQMLMAPYKEAQDAFVHRQLAAS